MFSGIVADSKSISALEKLPGRHRLSVNLGKDCAPLKIGDSVAVNGVCLTVVELNGDTASFDIIPQTLAQTNLNTCAVGDKVNVELSLTYGAPVGGHMVQGHVDTTLGIVDIVKQGDEWQVTFALPEKYNNYVVDKGFVTIDGMSLTVQQREDDRFMVALIPHTRASTIAQHYAVSSRVNFEADSIAKYIEQYLEHRHA